MEEVEKILFVGSKSKFNSPYQNWYLVLKDLSKKLISFDPHWTTICNGREFMNESFIKTIKDEKPSLIFFLGGLNEFDLNTFIKIKKEFPSIKTFIPLSDEDVRFESYSRFILIFIDYGLVYEKWFLDNFKKDGTPGVYHLEGINTSFFRPLNVKKDIDVSFIGRPLPTKSLRYEYIKYLKEKGIKASLFGPGWENYGDLKDIYQGPLESEEMVKMLNRTKVSLCLSRGADGNLHENYRFFESGACRVFTLTEFFKGYLAEFKEGKNLITFKTKEEMLDKINFFLKEVNKRENIAKEAYQKIKEKYSFEKNLKNILKKVSKDDIFFKRTLPNIPKTAIFLTEKDINLSIPELRQKISDCDYIGFKDKFSVDLPFKEYLQRYSLFKSGKNISICDYFVSRPLLRKYLLFDAQSSFKTAKRKDFLKLLFLSQIMVKKEFFLKNVALFRKKSFEKLPLNQENISFINIPLIEVSKSPKVNPKIIRESFYSDFIYFLYSMKHHRNILRKGYIFGLFLEILRGRFFIIRTIFRSLKDKNRRNQMQIYENVS